VSAETISLSNSIEFRKREGGEREKGTRLKRQARNAWILKTTLVILSSEGKEGKRRGGGGPYFSIPSSSIGKRREEKEKGGGRKSWVGYLRRFLLDRGQARQKEKKEGKSEPLFLLLDDLTTRFLKKKRGEGAAPADPGERVQSPPLRKREKKREGGGGGDDA